MFVLHVDLEVKPESQREIESVYETVFRPAISKQAGYQAVGLLRPDEGGDHYRLTIAFINRESQQQWVATELHQAVWPQMESRCAGFSVNYYAVV
jgi:heme-degrading monooxygenase HmoA